LLENQAHILAQFVSLAHEENVDAILIAGDVYDRSVPPAEAVALLDKVLAQLVIEHQIPVILIDHQQHNLPILLFYILMIRILPVRYPLLYPLFSAGVRRLLIASKGRQYQTP